MKVRVSLVLFLPLLIFIFDLGFFAASLLPTAKSPSEVSAVDLIAVLTGGQGRLREAIGFLTQRRGRYLFISGVAPGSTLENILKANRIESFPLELKPNVFLDEESRSTSENAAEVRQMIQRFNAHSVLLVTSSYHLQRATRLLKRELHREPALDIKIETYPVESRNFERDTWWWRPTSWDILLTEYFKSLPYRVGL